MRMRWEDIIPVKDLVCIVLGEAQCRRAEVVLQELMENAVKYGSPSDPVEVEVAKGLGRTEVRVSNRANPSRIEILRREFKKVVSETAKDAFVKAVQRLRKPTGSSMLGLARVFVDAEMNLEAKDGMVHVTATIR